MQSVGLLLGWEKVNISSHHYHYHTTTPVHKKRLEPANAIELDTEG